MTPNPDFRSLLLISSLSLVSMDMPLLFTILLFGDIYWGNMVIWRILDLCKFQFCIFTLWVKQFWPELCHNESKILRPFNLPCGNNMPKPHKTNLKTWSNGYKKINHWISWLLPFWLTLEFKKVLLNSKSMDRNWT